MRVCYDRAAPFPTSLPPSLPPPSLPMVQYKATNLKTAATAPAS